MNFELPGDEMAEKFIIGTTLADGRIPPSARDLATTDFHSPVYRAAWGAFLELDADGREIEPFAAFDIIKRTKPNFEISHLTQTTVGMTKFNEAIYVKKIKSESARRNKIRELWTGIEELQNGGDISWLKNRLEDLDLGKQNRFRSLAEILETEVKPALIDLHRGITNRIPTGFEAIDRVIGGGLSLSDVLLVAALPSSGKSAFVLQTAVSIAKQGVPVAFLSGEMSDGENAKRLLSQAARFLNLNSAVHISSDELDFLTKWADALKTLPIHFDSKTYDLQSLARSLRSLIDETGIKVLFIDYIQLLKLNRFEKQSRYERITECSQEVKRIAMEFGIAVVEVAQFNREGAKSGKPSMHDLEGSSQLEKDTSLIFILDREENSDEVTLRIVKGRNTGTCEIKGRFTGATLNFSF